MWDVWSLPTEEENSWKAKDSPNRGLICCWQEKDSRDIHICRSHRSTGAINTPQEGILTLSFETESDLKEMFSRLGIKPGQDNN